MSNLHFRAYVNGEMKYNVMLNMWGNYGVFEHGTLIAAYPNVPVMQYVLRKDRDGVKVYGADILKASDRDGARVCVVYWNERVLSWYVKDNTTDFDEPLYIFACVNRETFTVIGNSIENPELSKKG